MTFGPRDASSSAIDRPMFRPDPGDERSVSFEAASVVGQGRMVVEGRVQRSW
jgi:hypothetical protein